MTVPWSWKEVNKINHSFILDIAGLENVRGWEVLLLCGVGAIFRGADGEVSSLFGIKKAAKDGWRVEVWPGWCQNRANG
jgi:hypothetical protein